MTTKQRRADLAMFGGTPAFESPVVFGRPNIGNRAVLFDRFDRMLDAKWLSNGGELSREFERRVAELAGTRYCVATCNATSALQLAVQAAGLRGEVIVPAFTFAATAHAAAWLGVTPVFCDVDPWTGSADPRSVEELITADTTGILGVHIWGRPRALEAMQDVADRHGLALIYDSAHAFGCGYAGRPIGGFGTAEVFSFHSTKFVNTFEGGALVTDDPELAEKAGRLKNFGISSGDDVVSVGTNAKLSEAAAAMGLTSLDSMDYFVARNRENYHRYRQGLRGVDGLSLLDIDESQRSNYQYLVVDCDTERIGVTRDDILALLAAENVYTRRYFYPGCHRMAPYRTDRAFPGTDRVARDTFVLPTGADLEPRDITRICELLGFIAANGFDIHAAMGSSGRAA
ncbi:aminotransferase class I/II-fold pyridoxal phosphate-dependent enzyme [Nocardia brasiliensis]|uniref:aminotransferase class I/II-fold pyridoxal phosphate-dependent enzyme n=1 Tax=Nocardia brasiliensis TaxID=37326 RepID=UPI0009DE3191|nr:aminotransferase class I/II-fold pyridoxal phosphate-dependent enzyme [Nocardia brasiliensis]